MGSAGRFRRAATGDPGFATFWLLFFAIAILDDAQRRDDKRRRKREAQPQPKRKTAAVRLHAPAPAGSRSALRQRQPRHHHDV